MSDFEPARDALESALQSARGRLRGDRQACLDSLIGHLGRAPRAQSRLAVSARDRLEQWILAYAEADATRAETVRYALGKAAEELAAAGDVPQRGPRADAWQATLGTVARLGNVTARSYRPARLLLVGGKLLANLVSESRAQKPSYDGVKMIAGPGPILRDLTVDPRVRTAVSRAVGFRAEPLGLADYVYYDTPGAHLAPHVDGGGYEIVLLITIERTAPQGGSRSALVVHPPGRRAIRIVLEPGEAVALRGRHIFHAREPVKAGERVTIALIGFWCANQKRRVS